MSIGRLDIESDEYRKRRDALQRAEIDLRDARERVAALRRSLPQDSVIDDCSFERVRAGAREPVRLSELFEEPGRSLVLMHFMFGKAQNAPCPMCTLWADGYDGIVRHLRRRVNFAVLVAGDAAEFEAYARSRGWRDFAIVSAADSDLKRRLGFEAADGSQYAGVSVFSRSASGELIHSYSQCALYDGNEVRGMDLLSPFWNFLDLTPEGRGDFFPSVDDRD